MRFLLVLVLTLTPLGALAHEFWIEAERWQLDARKTLIATLRNGEAFKGVRHVFIPRRFTRFDLVQGDLEMPVTGRLGDEPALQMGPLGDGLVIAAYESTPQELRYDDWEKFLRFAGHKDFPDIAARHNARALPRTGFTERYTRHVKALMAVGDGTGVDRALGLETEFVALRNPYVQAGPMRVRLLYQGQPRANAQVEVFERAPDGTVTITRDVRTDAAGEAEIALKSGHIYLLDAVVLREATGNAVWETLWAAMTFAVPE